MRRTILSFAAMALMGFLATDASACCHKKKAACTPACAPAPVVECAPAPVCAPAKKKCFGGGLKMLKGGLCHKKAAACAPVAYAAPACNTCGETYAAPVTYGAPQASPQGWAAPTGQTLVAPHK